AANNGEFTVGSLTEFISLFSALTWPTMALARFLSLFSQAQASGQRIKEFLDTKPTVVDGDDLIEVDEISPSITVNNLTFNYPDDDEKVLKDISFEIKAGEMVGILGKTGSGKTTLVDLLLRVYNVENDKVLLGGHDIMKLPIKKVRDTIGYVPQDNFLFSDTIKNNIGFSRDKFTDEEIIDSAKFADIYENVVDFKEGFQTVLGERGVTVSGGQKQRISIARALTKNPDILILDDSVSAVDTKTEETIINNLYKLRKNKTTILIAHRISTVKDLDKIIIIDEGEIVAIGSHKELMKKSPFYQEIVKRQTLEEKVMEGEYNV
ncbi:MAG TPA: ABC transporter ATP-binding protein, partial [Acholeplasma sp.]|nr:ABC transporter ATP-binding protein [Acholeplasma sp.]